MKEPEVAIVEAMQIAHSAIRTEGIDRGEPVTIFFDGIPVEAFAGESVAAALLASGVRQLRSSPRAGSPRGAFCLMGVCQECVVTIDGSRVPSCQAPVRAGLTVASGRRT